MELERWIPPRRHHEVEARRCDLQQVRDAGEHALVRELIEIVEHEDDRLPRVELREGLADHGRIHARRHVLCSAHARSVERGDHPAPESLGAVVALVEGQPGSAGRSRTRLDPRAQQCRLAGSRRRGDERQPTARHGRREALEETRSHDDAPPARVLGLEFAFRDGVFARARRPTRTNDRRRIRAAGRLLHGIRDVCIAALRPQ